MLPAKLLITQSLKKSRSSLESWISLLYSEKKFKIQKPE